MEQFINTIRELDRNKLIALSGVLLAVSVFFFYLLSFSNKPDMGLLYSNLEQEEAARVVDKLKTAGVPFEIQANGTQLLAPSEKIPELRMDFVLNGVVSSGSLGYEIFDRSDVLGTSSAMLNINHVRALEGELSKSIKTVGDVQSARVHLVIPKRELFSKDKQQPSASVVLRMKSGQRLSSNQIQAVQSLITTAISNMTADRISIIDDKGTLLAKGRDAGGITDTSSSHLSMREEYEEKIARQIEMLLERTVGVDKVRVEVSADMDFDRTTTQSINYDPDGQVARTVNTTEEGVNSNEVSGAADAVSIQNAIPNEENQNAGGGSGVSESKNASNKLEEVTSFEISNKTTTVVHEAGNVKRLSVAVLIDGVYKKDDNGKVVYEERSQDEITQLTDLVQTAVGFKSDRGDTVRVINMKFQSPEDRDQIQDIPFWQSWLFSLDFKRLIELTIVGIFGLILIFSFLKPSIKKIMNSAPATAFAASTPSPASAVMNERSEQITQKKSPEKTTEQNLMKNPFADMDDNIDDDTSIMLDQVEGGIRKSTINRISKFVEKNPQETVALLRSWLYEDDE